jgi:hypothetical protein
VLSSAARGQSLVEFGLILPLLLILLLGIADFGRVFASAIITEAAARNAAEAAAQEYLQLDLLDGNSDGSLTAANYQALHATAFEVACREAERLPDRILGGPGNCVMPVIGVCVHDTAGGDGNCAETSDAFDPVDCDQMVGGWTTAQLAPASTPYVEVRMCYRFDPLITVPLGDWGSVWLQRENYFTVANY